VGCTARIVDFHTLHDGLLGISCVGERKFRVLRVWRADDGLNMGEVAWLPVEPELPVPADCERLASTLRRALEELAEHYENVARKFDDAAWIGSRVAELLPIELADKQALLELDDPIERLRSLLTVVKE